MTAALLEARCLSLALARREILREVSVELHPGRVLAILGANGAGKSTLLRALAGGLRPTQGTVEFAGQAIDQWDRIALAQRRALMSASVPVEFPFCVEELVQLGRHPHREDPSEDRRCVSEAMAFAEVTSLAGRRLSSLSSGERQRVELARTLAQIWQANAERPCALLLDEPTANLDLAHATALLGRVRSACQRGGLAVAMVVHDLNLALRYADEIVLLAGGSVLARGTPALLLDQPELLRVGFELDADVIPHPRGGWPVILPVGAAHPHDPT